MVGAIEKSVEENMFDAINTPKIVHSVTYLFIYCTFNFLTVIYF